MNKSLLFLLSVATAGSGKGYAQLNVNTGASAATLVSTLVDPSLMVSNITETKKGAKQAGTFISTGTNLNIGTGIILSTGDASKSVGPNTDDATSTSYTPLLGGASADPELQALIGTGSLYDLYKLEFDLKPTHDTLTLTYVFGSDEYLEYAPPNTSTFNDVFGFFLKGGTEYPSYRNFALVPGTTSIVSVKSINKTVSNTQFYVDNPYNFSSTNPLNIQYDGFTKVLNAKIKVTPGLTYRVKLALADVGDANYDSGIFIKAGSIMAVPIKLLSLSARKHNGYNQIEWTTASEQNSDHIAVLRSSDGRNFEEIGKRTAAGNSSVRKQYIFRDEKPLTGTTFYRLKEVDLNGTSRFSNIISLENRSVRNIQIDNIYPNPLNGNDLNSQIYLPSDGMIHTEIIDLAGKKILSQTFEGQAGLNQITVLTSSLEKGIYFFRVYNEDYTGTYQRIVN
jgi:hypothetical protein